MDNGMNNSIVRLQKKSLDMQNRMLPSIVNMNRMTLDDRRTLTSENRKERLRKLQELRKKKINRYSRLEHRIPEPPNTLSHGMPNNNMIHPIPTETLSQQIAMNGISRNNDGNLTGHKRKRGKNDVSDQEKKRIRRMKNREAAQKSRERKRKYVKKIESDLEFYKNRLNIAHKENEILRKAFEDCSCDARTDEVNEILSSPPLQVPIPQPPPPPPPPPPPQSSSSSSSSSSSHQIHHIEMIPSMVHFSPTKNNNNDRSMIIVPPPPPPLPSTTTTTTATSHLAIPVPLAVHPPPHPSSQTSSSMLLSQQLLPSLEQHSLLNDGDDDDPSKKKEEELEVEGEEEGMNLEELDLDDEEVDEEDHHEKNILIETQQKNK